MNSKEQGNIGVAVAISYYTVNNYSVSIPIGDSTKYDLIVDNGRLWRVQVKTTGHIRYISYIVQLSTQGGNRSWDRSCKTIDDSNVDLVFIYCMDGTMYELPIGLVIGKRNLILGSGLRDYKLKQ